MFFQEFNLNKKDIIYLCLTFLFSFLTIYELINFYMGRELLNPDIAIYLLDALKFAGMDYYNVCHPENIYYSPVICFLTSLIFRLGLVDKLAIFIVTGIFGIICELGMYILFRYRFDSLFSFMGVILFGSLSAVLWNMLGLLDIPSVAVSIWVIIFTILAMKKNPKFFVIVFPLCVLGFFTRYTTGFILPVIFVYYAIDRGFINFMGCFFSNHIKFKEKMISYLKSDEFKYIFISFFLGSVLTLIICLFILNNGGSLTFLPMSTNTVYGLKFNPRGIDSNLSRAYYFVALPRILFDEGRILNFISFFILLFILLWGSLLKVSNTIEEFKSTKINFKNKYFNLILKLLFGINVMGIILGVLIRNHMVSNICVMIALIILGSLHCNKNSNFKFTLLNLAWFLMTFIFLSIYPTKTLRYGLTFIIPLIYFIILGFEEILNKLNKHFNNIKSNIIPIIFILFLVTSTFIFIEYTCCEVHDFYGIGLENVETYIINHDSNYHYKKMIASEHYFSIVQWSLNMNGTYLRDYEIMSADNITADYLIVHQNIKFKNYHEIYKYNEVRLLVPN